MLNYRKTKLNTDLVVVNYMAFRFTLISCFCSLKKLIVSREENIITQRTQRNVLA